MPLTPWFSQMLTCTGPSRNLSAALLPGVAALSVDSGRVELAKRSSVSWKMIERIEKGEPPRVFASTIVRAINQGRASKGLGPLKESELFPSAYH